MDYKKSAKTEEQMSMLASQGSAVVNEQLFLYYLPKIKRVIASRVRDRAIVEDLSQEVLIKIYNGLPAFSFRSKMSSWIYQITLNTLKNYYRSQDKYQYTEFEENTIDQAEESDPLNCLMGLDLEDKMQEAIDRLPKLLWSSYYLNQFEGQTYQQISIQMHCPIGTVRSRVHRARQFLKDYLS